MSWRFDIAAGRHQSHEMNPSRCLACRRDERAQGGALGQRAILHGIVDARQILHDQSPGADIGVADLGISHLTVRQTDGAARCGEQRMRGIAKHPVIVGMLCCGDGVVGGIGALAPTIQDTKHRRTRAPASSMTSMALSGRQRPLM